MCVLLYPKDFFSGLFTSPRAAMVLPANTQKVLLDLKHFHNILLCY